jgi:hypothetical protein
MMKNESSAFWFPGRSVYLIGLALAFGACTPDGPIVTDGPCGAPWISSISPTLATANMPVTLTIDGSGFGQGNSVTLNGAIVTSTVYSSTLLVAALPAQVAGVQEIKIHCDALTSDPAWITFQEGLLPDAGANEAGSEAPDMGGGPAALLNPGDQSINEDQLLSVNLVVSGFDSSTLRIFLDGLPPGASFNEVQKSISFKPDFIQGGRSWTIAVKATDGQNSKEVSFSITVNDTIQPPWPTISSQSSHSGHTRLLLSQVSDAYLDSAGQAGRAYSARVAVPTSASANNKKPVRIYLHGLGASPINSGSSSEFRIYPHDPDNTYWWGYSENLPQGSATSGVVPNYTQRRALHLLEWVLKNYPGADGERVWTDGSSMGGAGGKTLGLLNARHFSYARGVYGQAIPRNHRSSRVSQLSGHWGTPELNLSSPNGMGVWDYMDLTRALENDADARNLFVQTKHGKDDGTIHFGAMVIASALTGSSFYQALQNQHTGHFVVWDEGGHGSSDPVMGKNWWGDWNPVNDLRRNAPFVAFSDGLADDNPGDGQGNGKQNWSSTAGYAGTVSVSGDTGWNGDVAGTRNRYLRWSLEEIVDTQQTFTVPLRVDAQSGSGPPKAGYPPKDGPYLGSIPVIVNVTPRRVQLFKCLPGETIYWSFATQSGQAVANQWGEITITQLAVTESWQTLELVRALP